MSTKSLWWWTSGQFRMRLRWTTDIEKVRKNHRHDCSILLKWWLCDIRRKWRQPSESERLRCWTRVSLCRIPRSKLRDLQTKTCWCNVNKLGVGWFTMTAHQCLKELFYLKTLSCRFLSPFHWHETCVTSLSIARCRSQYLDTQIKMFFDLSRAPDKENILSPLEESNLTPPTLDH